MSFDRLEDIVAYQFAVEFRTEVHRLLDGSPGARRDFKYREQVTGAADGVDACIAEGFARFVPGEFATFLRYALASLQEVESRLAAGVTHGYFSQEACAAALTWARRCRGALRPLHASQLRRIAQERERKERARRPRR